MKLVVRGEGRVGSKEVLSATWIKVHKIADRLAVNALRLQLGIGESEAIVLAAEIKADFIILDDWRARATCNQVRPYSSSHTPADRLRIYRTTCNP